MQRPDDLSRLLHVPVKLLRPCQRLLEEHFREAIRELLRHDSRVAESPRDLGRGVLAPSYCVDDRRRVEGDNRAFVRRELG